ncbi:MAG: discoidin domain-containing protein [Paludibacteraceae bacterium]|nr:discoidin domain-containing protein [Paludibacteraceae bacterium]
MKHFYFTMAFLAISVLTFGQKYSGLTATASSGNAALAVDNNPGTRWESAFEDPQWLVVDLGEIKAVGVVKILWEGANAKDYTVSFSTNGVDFSGEITFTDKPGGSRTDVIDGLNVNCRYIKMNGTARNLTYGYSIWEFEVYPQVTPVLTSLTVTPASSSIKIGETQQLAVGGLDQLGNPFTLTTVTQWSVDGSGASVDANGLFSSTQKGLFTVTATNTELTQTAKVEVLPAANNLSIGEGVTATASAGNAIEAIDNNPGTRWESASEDPQWIMIDFASPKNVTDIVISWEAANAKDYIIESSNNGTDWTTRVTKEAMPEGMRTDYIFDLSFEARYVRLTGTARNLNYGYSIWEFKVFGTNTVSTLSPFPAAEKQIMAYPNPVTDRLYFHNKVQQLHIFNTQGQKVASFKEVSELDVTSFAKGFYFVRLTDDSGKTLTQKIDIR